MVILHAPPLWFPEVAAPILLSWISRRHFFLGHQGNKDTTTTTVTITSQSFFMPYQLGRCS